MCLTARGSAVQICAPCNISEFHSIDSGQYLHAEGEIVNFISSAPCAQVDVWTVRSQVV